MVDFRAKRAQSMPARRIQPIADAKPTLPSGHEKRRGVRVNSRVPVAVEWQASGQVLRKEAQTRVVSPYGCMVILPASLEVRQAIQLTNMVSRQTNSAVIVWRGQERPEGLGNGHPN